MKNNFVLEDLEDAIKKLRKMGRKVDADTISRKDLLDLTKAKGNWELTPKEMDKVTRQTKTFYNADTKPNINPDTIPDDSALDSMYAKTSVDDFSSTEMVSRVANELAAKLSSANYRSLSPDELKAAIEVELKNYLK